MAGVVKPVAAGLLSMRTKPPRSHDELKTCAA